MKIFINKLKSFFDNISSKPSIGGLQITDTSVQLVFIDRNTNSLSKYSIRIPPGIIQGGKIRDEAKLLEYFKRLHSSLFPNDSDKKVKVVVSLPSAIAYTQIVDIPNVGEKNLAESAKLNIQMVSPIDAENAYMGWQLVSETDDKYEILGAFAEKDVVDKFISVMNESNFQAIAMEFPSLSLSWMITNIVGVKEESFLILNIASDGFDIFLLKNGSIYFDYFQSWKSVQREGGQISKDDFHNVIIDEVRKVVNFTSNRFGENLKRALLVAPGLGDSLKSVLEKNFNLKVANLVSNFKDLSPVWYVAFGSAVRGTLSRGDDKFISLGTESAQTIFYREQVIDFIKLWRNIIVSALVSFLVLFGGSIFLINSQPSIISEGAGLLNIEPQASELKTFISRVEEYNNLTESISNTQDTYRTSLILNNFNELTRSHGVTVNNINITSITNPISVTAEARSHNDVIRFRDVLVESNLYSQITLPFSDIVKSEDGKVKFFVSFLFTGNAN
ncbi:MAG: hypothetical protein WD471_00445 [Candidatus Paceibacterota bacterium]